MTPGIVNLEIRKGAEVSQTFTWMNEDRTPKDLTNWSAYVHFRPERLSETIYDSLTTDNGKIVITGPLGKIRLLLTKASTESYLWTVGTWDLLMVSPDTTTRTHILEGRVDVITPSTRNV